MSETFFGRTKNLVIQEEDGEIQIWWEDLLILGAGPTLADALREVAGTVRSIQKELPELCRHVPKGHVPKEVAAIDQTRCSHKFIDSKNCLKCGWIP